MFEALKKRFTRSASESAQPVMAADEIRTLDEITALIDAGLYSNGLPLISIGTAMRQATVWACVRIISEIIAQLPPYVQRKERGQWITADTHEIVELLTSPNDWQTQHDLISTLIMWAETDGNGYLYKVKNRRGQVVRLLPIQSRSVQVTANMDWTLRYDIANTDGGITGHYTPAEIFHLRNFGSEGYRGLSTIGNHRKGIGLAIQLEDHASNAYANGLQSRHYLYSEKNISKDLADELKTTLAGYTSALNAGKIPFLRGGVELKDLPELRLTDAQYIESRRMQQQQIASIFGVPMFLLNDTEKATTWGTGLEQFTKSFVRFSLSPRMNRLGQTLVKELLPVEERARTRVLFDTDSFTLGEFKERMDGYKSGIESGVLNPDEAREREGLNPREDGNGGRYRMPMNIGFDDQADADQNPDESTES